MPGRHAAATPRRKGRQRPWLQLLVVPAFVLAASAALLSAKGPINAALGCADQVEVAVAAAPESVSLLEAVAEALEKEAVAVDGDCVDFQVVEATPGEVSRSVAAGAAERPDLWVPDSSAWLERIYRSPVDPIVVDPSVGRTPVVVAGKKLEKPSSWRAVLSRKDVAFVDPVHSSAPVGALLALGAELEADGSAQQMDGLMVPLAQRLGGDQSAARDLVELVRNPDGVAVLTEQQLLDLRSRGLGEGLAVHVPPGGATVLDYPLVAVSDDPAVAEAGEVLADFLGSHEGAELLETYGFRGKDLAPLSDDRGAGKIKALPTPKPEAVATMLRRWSLLTVPSQILGVFDVSGSMDERAGRTTRVRLVTQACLQGLGMFPDQSRIGLWAFSSEVGRPGQDYRKLVPLRRLDAKSGGRSHRVSLEKALRGLPRLTGGGTGLNDTTLAAVRAAREKYDPKAENRVVLLTDGRNDDPGSISIRALQRTLSKEYDPYRPVSVVAIGIGPDADAKALKRIAAATGGHSYIARNPQALGRVFQEALLNG